MKERRGLLVENGAVQDSENPLIESCQVAYPIEVSEKLHGVVVLEVVQHPRHEVQALLRKLHWGAAWLEVMIRRTEAVQCAEVNDRSEGKSDGGSDDSSDGGSDKPEKSKKGKKKR